MGRLVPAKIVAPGFYGMNRQLIVAEDFRWAQEATNCVIDESGRLAARKGRKHLTTTALSGLPDVQALAEYIPTSGASTIVSAANNKLYTGTTSLTDHTGTAAGVTGITANHWQFQNINGKLVGFQAAHDPIVSTGGDFALLQQSITSWTTGHAYVVGDVVKATATNKTLYFHCTTAGTSHATTEPTWNTTPGATTTDNTVTWTTRTFPNGNVCHAAFGRIWVTASADNTVIEFSDTLLPHIFRGGAAGTLDLKTVWSGDSVQAIASFENLLVIFGKKTILLYTGPDDPSTMTLAEKIEGTGCIARDSVAVTGNDIVFLSASGVRSLARTVSAGGKEPLGDKSKNVRDYLMGLIANETMANVKAAYHEADGFYVLALPASGKEFVFDTRYPLEDGSFRVTTWSNFNATSLLSASDRILYAGYTGLIAKYSDYNDYIVDATTRASSASTYNHRYRSTWSNFGKDVAQLYKILKNMRAVVYTTFLYTINFSFGTDFDESSSISVSTTLGSIDLETGGAPAEWNAAEWNVGEWSGTTAGFAAVRASPSGHGTDVKFGWDVTINGAQLGFQEVNLLAKLGRYN